MIILTRTARSYVGGQSGTEEVTELEEFRTDDAEFRLKQVAANCLKQYPINLKTTQNPA